MSVFPKYDRYKDSGVEWLGEIPDDWEAERVFSQFNERVERGNNELPILNISIKHGVQEERPEGDREQRTIEDRTAYKRANAGDIAYNTMRMWQGAVGNVPVDGLISPAYVVARPIKDINTRYYSYLFRGEHFQVETNRHSYGIVSDRNRLYWLGFKNIVIPIPPKPEQDRIVTFLDRKTAEIDALIAKKQGQIELLDEQKAILINRAVTRGLNPNAKLKPSGIEWIGEIPEHWEISRVGAQLDFISYGFTNPMPSTDSGPPMVTANDIGGGRVLFESARSTAYRDFVKLTRKSKPHQRDILVTKDGTLGRVGLVTEDIQFCINQSVALLRPKAAANERFLALLLQAHAYNNRMIFEAGGTTIKHIYISRLSKMPFAVPPERREQDAIISYISELHERHSQLCSQLEEMITLLQGSRSTLIAHAVTGRIKV